MVNKILKYAGKFKWLTLLATIMVIIAVVAQILPYIYVWQSITPLIAGETLETSFIVSKIIALAICLILNVLLYIGGLGFSHIAEFNTLCNLRLSI